VARDWPQAHGSECRGARAGARAAINKSTWLYLIRHGEIVGASTRRFVGHIDVPLSSEGEAQLHALARELASKPLAAIYSSDLGRARLSAEILAAPHGITPIALPALREMSMGRWEGLTADEIQATEPEAFTDWMAQVGEFPFPGGESVLKLAQRVMPVISQLVERHRGESIALVAHGGTNRVILCRTLGISLEKILTFGQDYGALSLLEWNSGQWILHLLNHRANHSTT